MRRCALCGKLERNLIGGLCGRCDHIQGDVMADLWAEFNTLCGGADETR
jgi:NMD protein affecting ribosome stability and mRNA decay